MCIACLFPKLLYSQRNGLPIPAKKSRRVTGVSMKPIGKVREVGKPQLRRHFLDRTLPLLQTQPRLRQSALLEILTRCEVQLRAE